VVSSALERVADCYTSTLDCFKRTSTVDALLSMSGCSIADDSTSEELLWRSIATSKEYNININDVKVQPAA